MLELPGAQLDAELATQDGLQIGEAATEKELIGLRHLHGMAGGRQPFEQDTEGQRLAVHQHAVAIEDDQAELGRHSAHPIAAVDIEGLGDDVIGVGGGEEDRRAGDVARNAHAAIGNGQADLALLLAQREVFVSGE